MYEIFILLCGGFLVETTDLGPFWPTGRGER